jgi:uncharacterized protein YlxW (UPF0749 family)
MKKILKEKIGKAKIAATRSMVAILCVIFGILITAQWRSIPERVTNPIAPYISLKDTKDSLYEEQTQLKNEIADLQKLIEENQKNSENSTLTKTELADLRAKKAQAGLTQLNGPGIIINLDDSKMSPATEDSIVHAADVRDSLNLLWGAGAEAISINGQRVVINTAVDCIVNTILINNIRISTPIRIEAIGDQNLMYSRLTDVNALSDIYRRRADQGLKFDISRNNDITVPIFDGSFDIQNGVTN